MEKSKLLLLTILLGLATLTFSSCAPYVGRTVDAPEIPVAVKASDARSRLGATLSIGEITDSRESLSEESEFTEPVGDVTEKVRTALQKTLNERGVMLVPAAPLALFGEVRQWRSSVNAKGTTSISSEAALYVELRDPTNKRIYTGTYHGSRSSEFPLSSVLDVQDSLGIAMSQAINQMLSDPEFNKILSSY